MINLRELVMMLMWSWKGCSLLNCGRADVAVRWGMELINWNLWGGAGGEAGSFLPLGSILYECGILSPLGPPAKALAAGTKITHPRHL